MHNMLQKKIHKYTTPLLHQVLVGAAGRLEQTKYLGNLGRGTKVPRVAITFNILLFHNGFSSSSIFFLITLRTVCVFFCLGVSLTPLSPFCKTPTIHMQAPMLATGLFKEARWHQSTNGVSIFFSICKL